jgi:hypothetical protein
MYLCIQCINLYVSVYVCMYICMYVCVSVRAYVCACMCAYNACMYDGIVNMCDIPINTRYRADVQNTGRTALVSSMLPTYQYIYLSMYLPPYQHIYLCMYLPPYQRIYLSMYLPTSQYIYHLPTYLSILPTDRSIKQSKYRTNNQPPTLSLYLSLYHKKTNTLLHSAANGTPFPYAQRRRRRRTRTTTTGGGRKEIITITTISFVTASVTFTVYVHFHFHCHFLRLYLCFD